MASCAPPDFQRCNFGVKLGCWIRVAEFERARVRDWGELIVPLLESRLVRHLRMISGRALDSLWYNLRLVSTTLASTGGARP